MRIETTGAKNCSVVIERLLTQRRERGSIGRGDEEWFIRSTTEETARNALPEA